MSNAATPEHWLPIAGLEGRYEVSDLGRVRSLDQHLVGSRGKPYVRHGRVLRPAVGTSGYPFVSLPDDTTRSGYRVRNIHVLVAETFLGSREEGMEVRHLDGNRTDCRLSNLAWGTRLENEEDKRRHRTHWKTKLTACPLGHDLVEPNLVVGALKRGSRNCRACACGRSAVARASKRGVAADLKAEADRYYRSIMEL